MIKKTTILSALFLFIIFFLVREYKNTDLFHKQQKEILKESTIQKEKEILQLQEVNKTYKEEIDIIYKKNDSLEVEIVVREYKLDKAKKRINHESTKAIINAPDSTIIRILTEHEFETYINR